MGTGRTAGGSCWALAGSSLSLSRCVVRTDCFFRSGAGAGAGAGLVFVSLR